MNSKPETFANRLREILTQRGITQTELSKKTGISKSSITHYLRGDWEAKQDNVYSIAYQLNVSEAWLMGFDVPQDRKSSPNAKAMDALHQAAEEKIKRDSILSLSKHAITLAKDFDRLDSWGKQSVRDLTDNELNRMDQQQALETLQADEEPRVINLYLEPSAAGIATPTEGEDFEPYELQPDDPQGAAFAVRIQGDSMEPYFPDGSTVFVNHDAMRDGDVGIFSVDGGSVCKQYHYDAVLGMTYLFSLNRKRADCDVVITRSSSHTLVCQGRVITRRHFPVPGMD